MSVFFAILAIILTIAWHEIGHLIAGIATRTKVDSFSIGFGPYVSFKHRSIDWRLSVIPLGGYVSFLDGDSPNCLENRHPLVKVFISLAGPIFNIFAAWLIVAMLFYFAAKQDVGLIESMGLSLSVILEIVRLTVDSLLSLIINFNIDNMDGPVITASTLADAYDSSLKKFLLVVAIANIGIGVFNLLPIPALDGGHIVADLIHWVSGFDVKKSMAFKLISAILMLSLLGLILVVTYFDVSELIVSFWGPHHSN